jgi:hypothetical protein
MVAVVVEPRLAPAATPGQGAKPGVAAGAKRSVAGSAFWGRVARGRFSLKGEPGSIMRSGKTRPLKRTLHEYFPDLRLFYLLFSIS